MSVGHLQPVSKRKGGEGCQPCTSRTCAQSVTAIDKVEGISSSQHNPSNDTTAVATTAGVEAGFTQYCEERKLHASPSWSCAQEQHVALQGEVGNASTGGME